ncbi:ABC2 type transporter superfamily protein [Acanthamoeba castellanii str. Neff]|uniref:ABC2 type transporter superfamily protein n=1 Tax=Acanthamoeba castellanii (strain ATCC 30010 / Neff) TaxID=1257118 RepID=L8H9U4_ACACF|nr:ABC2 type transporter superfamily protein [Acanthamoeba castellanii str. Neff]ELR21493.1 ABC2 type transporter superfamily protein [Acanthamoeba castellanii str. Neff]
MTELATEEQLPEDYSRLGVSQYARIDQPTPCSQVPPRLRLNLEWRNLILKFVVPTPPANPVLRLLLGFLPLPGALTGCLGSTMEIPILNNVSGSVRAGELVAIMGPTGSGKTTLLNVLSKRITHGGAKHLTGQVLINGNDKVTPARLKRRMAYVMQEDIFFPEISVRETVRTAAMLKLPRKMSAADKKAAVESVLSELGIVRCANTIVGDAWKRGISGGEKKRTNIATEIVGNRSLVFLDEPTSGLDAATSLGLVVSMRALAQSGHTVVSTIHQPSSAMFLMFDRVILLAEGGWTVYSGPTKDVLSYFASLGLHTPGPQYNAADFMLEVVSSTRTIKDGRTVRQLLIDSYAANHPTTDDGDKKQPLLIAADDDDDQHEKSTTTKNDTGQWGEEASLKDVRKGAKYPTHFLQQLRVLTVRTFKQRRPAILSTPQIIVVVVFAIVSGLFWLRMDKDEESLADRNAFLFYSAMYWTMETMFMTMLAFPGERAVLNKERDTGTYRLSSYFLAKVLAETPLDLVLPLFFGCITYWVVGLSAHAGAFFLWLLSLCLFTLLGSGLGLIVGAAIPNMQQAITISVIFILSSIILGGFFLSQQTLRVWIAWARWISIIKYSYELLLLTEYKVGDDTYTPAAVNNQYPTTGGVITGDDVLDYLNVETNIWADVLFLVGMIIVTRLLAYLALRFLNKKQF